MKKKAKKQKSNSHLQGDSALAKFNRWKLEHQNDKPPVIEDEGYKKWKEKFHIED